MERLRQVRASRSQAAVEGKLGALEDAARGAGNLMPMIFDAADAYATVGEISDRLRGVFGEWWIFEIEELTSLRRRICAAG